MQTFSKFKGKISGLSKRMLFYFSLIAFANVFVVAEVAWEMRSDAFRSNVIDEVVKIKQEDAPPEQVYLLLDEVTRKFIIMVLILIAVSAVVMYLFLIRIASPLQYMIEQAEIMSDGDLRNRIEVTTHDEIAVLGKLINDLSINLQEIISQINRQTKDLEELHDSFEKKIGRHQKLEAYFKKERKTLENLLQGFKIMESYYKIYSSVYQNPDKEIDSQSQD